MDAPRLSPTPHPPGRALLRFAGALTQVSCAACLLIGTIGLVLVEQNRTGGLVPVVAWLITAMAGLVFGGLIYRGGLVSMLAAAAIDAGFGIVLVTLQDGSLRRLLKILRPSDIAAIHDALGAAGWVMIGAGVICLIALPLGIRYARWFRDAAVSQSAMSTVRGFPPPPVPVRTATYIIPAEEQPGVRSRLYLVLGGVAIGVGVGIGALVSSGRFGTPHEAGEQVPVTPAHTASSSSMVAPDPPRVPEPSDAGVAAADPSAARARTATVAPTGTVQDLVLAQHAALARADRAALAGLLAPRAFGIGTDAGELADGRDAVVAQIVHDLGEPPASGFTIESRAIAIGEDRGHAWIAEQLEVADGREVRSFAISQLAAVIDGSWRVVALHWATPVDDATAQRIAILSRFPVPAQIADRRDATGELDAAVRAAFASRTAFAAAHSERSDAFNYGSGGERARGGPVIQRIFGKLKAELRIHDGARVTTGDAWDPAQQAAPWIGWAALNVEYTSRTRALTEVTQTFRVLAILIKEDRGWRIVQTQWSNGGPIH
ncbi:MAG TPA: nuclear transport factor 2 family protein [Kofleriaceae bacterium]|nr:nuclear transport factor 2 family protein [Kofleriaceae bacterium]